MILADSWGHHEHSRTQTQKVPLDSTEAPLFMSATTRESGSQPLNCASPSRRQFIAMDFLIQARQDPTTRPRTLMAYVRAAEATGLSTDEIAAGAGRTLQEVGTILAMGDR